MKSVDWLPSRLVGQLQQATEVVKSAFGDHLVALVLVGAAANPERHDRARAPELLAVVGELSLNDLREVAKHLGERALRGVRLRVMTSEELATSADVFSVEVAEYQTHHVALVGEDPFQTIEIAKHELRASVERALRGLGRRARNRVLGGMAKNAQREHPQRALAQSVERLLILARHTLVVLERQAPAGEKAVLNRLAEVLALDIGWLRSLLEQIRAGKEVADPLASTYDMIQLLKPMIAAVDVAELDVAELDVAEVRE